VGEGATYTEGRRTLASEEFSNNRTRTGMRVESHSEVVLSRLIGVGGFSPTEGVPGLGFRLDVWSGRPSFDASPLTGNVFSASIIADSRVLWGMQSGLGDIGVYNAYRFDFDVSSLNIQIAPDQEYIIAVSSFDSAGGTFGWVQSRLQSPNGSDYGYVSGLGTFDWVSKFPGVYDTGTAAFDIYGTLVPMPSCVVPMLGAVCVMPRRRRRNRLAGSVLKC
jgi:hypothetical protein